jgi:Tfp pilus assembly protein PilZ
VTAFPTATSAGPTSACPVDTDGDGTPDFLDLDSDNDCIPDSDSLRGRRRAHRREHPQRQRRRQLRHGPVHVVPPRDPKGRAPGVGVQFYAVDRAIASRWGRYIDQVRRDAGRPTRPRGLGPTPTAMISRSAVKEIADSLRGPGAPAAIVPTVTPAPAIAQVPAPRQGPPPLPPSGGSLKVDSPARPMPSRRKFPRYDAEMELDVRDLGELHRMLTRDVSHGGMFIVTDAPLEPGARLLIQVMHPVSDERFDISAVVRRREVNPQGIGVEFVDLTEARREAFMSFIRESLVTEDVLIVDENDPDLA